MCLYMSQRLPDCCDLIPVCVYIQTDLYAETCAITPSTALPTSEITKEEAERLISPHHSPLTSHLTSPLTLHLLSPLSVREVAVVTIPFPFALASPIFIHLLGFISTLPHTHTPRTPLPHPCHHTTHLANRSSRCVVNPLGKRLIKTLSKK